MRSTLKVLKFINAHGSALLLIFAILAVGLWLLVNHLKKQNFTDSRKSLIITLYSFGSILILLFFLRFWPPYGKSEMLIAQGGGGGGVELNYGNTDQGKGDDYLNETLEVNMKEVAAEPVESTPDEVLTQDNVGADVATPPKVKNKPKDKKPTETKTKPVETPTTPVRKTNSALSNMIKGNKKGGDGNSSSSGNQGSANGNVNSNGYYGNGGSGGGTGGGNGTGNGTGSGPGSGSGSGGGNGSGNGKGTNYTLSGRRFVSQPQIDNDCNQAGRVTIEVTVDRSGNVISAINGKGSTADACLINLAKKYAKQTKWSASETAAERQVGTITYNFSY